jgi:hypothetical protein
MGLPMQAEASVFKYILYIRLGAKTQLCPELENEFTLKTAAGNVTVLSRHRAIVSVKRVVSLQQLEYLIRTSAAVQHVSAAVTFSESNFLRLQRSA